MSKIALAAFTAFITGVLFGGSISENSRVNDCQIMGKFRHVDSVFMCKKVNGETE